MFDQGLLSSMDSSELAAVGAYCLPLSFLTHLPYSINYSPSTISQVSTSHQLSSEKECLLGSKGKEVPYCQMR